MNLIQSGRDRRSTKKKDISLNIWCTVVAKFSIHEYFGVRFIETPLYSTLIEFWCGQSTMDRMGYNYHSQPGGSIFELCSVKHIIHTRYTVHTSYRTMMMILLLRDYMDVHIIKFIELLNGWDQSIYTFLYIFKRESSTIFTHNTTCNRSISS